MDNFDDELSSLCSPVCSLRELLSDPRRGRTFEILQHISINDS